MMQTVMKKRMRSKDKSLYLMTGMIGFCNGLCILHCHMCVFGNLLHLVTSYLPCYLLLYLVTYYFTFSLVYLFTLYFVNVTCA